MKFLHRKKLPNVLTVLRIILTICFYFFLTHVGVGYAVAAFVVFVVAAITDYCDGYLAKKRNCVTAFGTIMDPIADKFLILCAFYVFTRLGVIYPWMFFIIFIREVLVTMFRLKAVLGKKYLAAEKLGKYKTVLQMTSIILILLYLVAVKGGVSSGIMTHIGGIIQFLMIITVVLTLYSGLSFLWNNRKAFSQDEEEDPVEEGAHG